MRVLLPTFLCLAGCSGAGAGRPRDEGRVHVPPPAAAPLLPPGPLTLDVALRTALEQAPLIRVAQARMEGASAGVEVAGSAWMPRLDFVWQSLRATRNNLSGTMLPNSVIPGLSGPVTDKSWDSAWGSAAGVIFSIEPLDFGHREAMTEVARQQEKQARADADVVRLETGAAAVDAFLAVLAADQAVKALQANLERWEVFARSVRALADRDLRPGVDASRAEAEAALARNQLIQATETASVARTLLGEAMGTGEEPKEIDPGPLLRAPASAVPPPGAAAVHPLLRRQAAAVGAARAREDALDKAYAPRIGLHFAFNDRGSGFDAQGNTLDPEDGLYPDRYNWVAGLSLTFSPLDAVTLGERRRMEEALGRAEMARAEHIALQLRAQEARVAASLDTARRISENMPVFLKAATEGQERARVRFDTGLGAFTEVAEAQRLRVQAEIDGALSSLAIWRALAARARIHGDLGGFLAAVAAQGKGK